MSVNLEEMKFNESDFAGKDISSLPDRPSDAGMSATQLKAHFDLVPKILIAMGKFNDLIDALHKSGAEAIGIKDLLEKIKGDIEALEQVESARAAQELARVEAEMARVEAEATREAQERRRVLAENLRSSAEADRGRKENERDQAEVNRAFEEEHRKRAEVGRQGAEEKRAIEENKRALSEVQREIAESQRTDAESQRVSGEVARISAEELRQSKMEAMSQKVDALQETVDGYEAQERARVGGELLRVRAEEARAAAEEQRSGAEAQRLQAENERSEAESVRGSAEIARRSAEEQRARAEDVRFANENVREENRRNFHFKGDHQSGQYKAYSMVRHLGKVYIANVDTENVPPHSDWLLISSEGKALDIGGTFPSVEALKQAYPSGHSKLFTVKNKIYLWTDHDWVAIGSMGGGVSSDEVLAIVQPKLSEKVDLASADYQKLLKIKQDVDEIVSTYEDAWADVIGQLTDLRDLAEMVNTNYHDGKKMVRKVDGKGLSTNDFTDDRKQFVDRTKDILGNAEVGGIFSNEHKVWSTNALLNQIMVDANENTPLQIQSMTQRIHPSGDWLQGLVEMKESVKNVEDYIRILPRRLIVNDLTTGGKQKALSAEQGKILFQNVDSGKKLLANAIIDKGQSGVSKESSFRELADAIERIGGPKDQTTDGKPFNMRNVSDIRRFISDNQSRMRVFPNLFDTSNMNDVGTLFYSCYSLEEVPMLDLRNATRMNLMFTNCNKIKRIPLFDTSKVTTMDGTFKGCISLKEVPLFDTGSVTSMDGTFSNCMDLKVVPKLNTSNVTNMTEMFVHCMGLSFVPKLDTSKVVHFGRMFDGCVSLDIPRMRAAGWEEKFLQTAPNYTAP